MAYLSEEAAGSVQKRGGWCHMGLGAGPDKDSPISAFFTALGSVWNREVKCRALQWTSGSHLLILFSSILKKIKTALAIINGHIPPRL